MRGTACHAVRDARPVPDLLEVAEAGAAMAVLGEARRAAVSAREDEWAIRATPSLLALDHRHQFGGGLGINRNLERALRLVQLPAQRQGAFGLGVSRATRARGRPRCRKKPWWMDVSSSGGSSMSGRPRGERRFFLTARRKARFSSANSMRMQGRGARWCTADPECRGGSDGEHRSPAGDPLSRRRRLGDRSAPYYSSPTER